MGLRFNFLSEDGIAVFINNITINGTIQTKLKNLFVKNNKINDFGISQLKIIYDKLKL